MELSSEWGNAAIEYGSGEGDVYGTNEWGLVSEGGVGLNGVAGRRSGWL